MKHILQIGIALALIGCADKPTVVPRVTQHVPAKVQPIRPVIEAVDAAQKKADAKSEEVDRQVAKVSDAIDTTQRALNDTLAEVKRLNEKKSATESELVNLYNRMVEQEKQYSVMRDEFTKAASDLLDERILRKKVTAQLEAAKALSIQKDYEVEELRVIVAKLIQTQEQSLKRIEELTAERDKLSKQYAEAKGVLTYNRNIFLIVLAVVILIASVKVILPLIKPRLL